MTTPYERELEAIRAEQELLPCPHCGGEAHFDDIEMQVQCRTSGCTGQSWMFDTMAEAIKAWNTRHA